MFFKVAKVSPENTFYFSLLHILFFATTNCLGISHKYTGCKVPFNGKDGVCVNLEKDVIRCPSVRDALLDKNFTDVHSTVCEEPNLLKLNETRICCSVEEYIELYSFTNTSFAAHKNFKLIPTLTDSNCGISTGSYSDRIIGGEDALPGEHPWMVRLGMTLDDDDQIRYPCSGSIINERYILTSAHCFKQGTLKALRLAETDEELSEECIEIGINSTVCQEIEDYEPEEIIIHKSYTGKIGSVNDIALIRLKQPIQNLSSPFTRPVCLPFIQEFKLPHLENTGIASTGSKNLASVQGWGKENNEDNIGTSKLKQVYVPLRSNILCRHVFKRANLTITDEQICVGGHKSKGSCSGDSGSPLLVTAYPLDKSTGKRIFQIGIVSYGRQQCGLENSPVVYTRVQKFLQWILDNIKE